jgi:hypothetical protein
MLDVATGRIDGVIVTHSRFRRDIGRAMMQHLERVARDFGVQHLMLDASLNAVDFYRSQGFQGDAVGSYHSPRGITLECVPMYCVDRLNPQSKPVPAMDWKGPIRERLSAKLSCGRHCAINRHRFDSLRRTRSTFSPPAIAVHCLRTCGRVILGSHSLVAASSGHSGRQNTSP